jgi:DNA-binding beta-propeller fold protein YncE
VSVFVIGQVENEIALLGRDAATGMLDFVEVERDEVGGVGGIGGAAAVAVSPDGTAVFVAGSEDDRITGFGRSPTGSLSYLPGGSGGIPIDDPSAIAFSPDARTLFVTARGSDELVVFWRDPATQSLGLAQRESVTSYHLLDPLAVEVDGDDVYVASWQSDAISHFVPEPSAGALRAAALLSVALLRRRSTTGRTRGSRFLGGTSATPRP